MGSSLGNFNRNEAASFLYDFTDIMTPKDMLFVGLDACQDEVRVFHAYNDREGKTHEFILNGLTNTNNIAGRTIFDHTDWKVVGEYNNAKQCHQAFYEAKNAVAVFRTSFRAGDRIRVEESY